MRKQKSEFKKCKKSFTCVIQSFQRRYSFLNYPISTENFSFHLLEGVIRKLIFYKINALFKNASKDKISLDCIIYGTYGTYSTVLFLLPFPEKGKVP